MEQLNSPISSASNIVRVTVPASVAYNFEAMTKVTQNILNKYGCGGCHSGRYIIFHMEDNFFVDEQLNIRSVIGNESNL